MKKTEEEVQDTHLEILRLIHENKRKIGDEKVNEIHALLMVAYANELALLESKIINFDLVFLKLRKIGVE